MLDAAKFQCVYIGAIAPGRFADVRLAEWSESMYCVEEGEGSNRACDNPFFLQLRLNKQQTEATHTTTEAKKTKQNSLLCVL